MLTISGKSSAPEITCQRSDLNTLRHFANENRKRGSFNDVTINVGEQNFPANRMVLSCYSKFFEEIFRSELKENTYQGVETKHIEPYTMEVVLAYIYTGTIQINSENVGQLISAANFLKIDDLKQFCFEYLETAISARASLAILRLAERFKSEKLKKKTNKFIRENFSEVIHTEDFKGLPLGEMKEWIFQQDRSKVDEITIYNAIIQWTNFKAEERRSEFSELFQKINLLVFPLEHLEDVVSHEPLVRGSLPSMKRLHDAVVELGKENRNKDCRSRIVSVGGHKTLTSVMEIFCLRKDEEREFTDIPVGLSSLCALVFDRSIYCIGGQTVPLKNETSTSLVYRMRLYGENPKWEKLPSMNKKRHVMGATVLNDSIFVVGGTDASGSKLSSGEYFTPSSNKWRNISPMNSPRSGTTLASCKGYLYAIGGFGNGKHLDTVERFNVHTDVWNFVASLQTPRRWLESVVLNGCVYAIGGQSGKDNKTILKSVEVYDTSKNSWRYVSDMHTERAACSACVFQGKIYVSGGLNKNGTAVASIERYNASFDRWTVVGETIEDLWHHATFAL